MSAEDLSAADVLSHHLVAEGLFRFADVATPKELWPLTVGLMPDEGMNAVAIYDTGSLLQGRQMRGGRKIEKALIQIRVRSNKYTIGYGRAKDLTAILDEILDEAVTVEEETVKIHAVSRKSGVVPLGQEVGKPRFLFTISAALSLEI